MSEQLSKRGLPHLILERHRIAECWDGLRADSPAWDDRLSLFPVAGVEPGGFATAQQMVDYLSVTPSRLARPFAPAWQ